MTWSNLPHAAVGTAMPEHAFRPTRRGRFPFLLAAACCTLSIDATRIAAQTCPIESPQNCQPFDDSLEFRNTYHYYGYLDDFRPVSDTISSVCVWGRYARRYSDLFWPLEPFDCAATYEDEEFVVQVLASNAFGFPEYDTEVAWQIVTSFDRVYIPGTAAEAATGIPTYRVHLPLPEPITGLDTSGSTRYWLAVSSWTGGHWACDWYWQTTDAIYNDFTAVWNDPSQPDAAVRYGDLAFCLDSGIQAGAGGSPVGYCCSCDGTCRDVSFRECRGAGDDWSINATCADVQPGACASGPPANDSCAVVSDPGFPALSVEEASYGVSYDNFCADTDGVNPVRTEFGEGVQLEGDVWFKYIMPVHLDYIGISSGPDSAVGGGFDSALAVYHDRDDPRQCVCPSSVAEHEAYLMWPCENVRGRADDDGVSSVPGGGYLYGASDPGDCFMIRVAGKQDAPEVYGMTRIGVWASYSEVFAPETIEDTTGYDKSRYVSFSVWPDPDSSLVGVRVRAFSVPGSPEVEGTELWVGPPRDVPDEDTSEPAKSIRVAPLQCDPYFADWSRFGLVHAYGSEIVPGAQYRIEAVFQNCCSLDTPWCAGWPAWPVTGKFGDVVALFDGDDPGAPQPDFNDVAAIVKKFLADPAAPSKVDAQLVPNVVFPDRQVDFKDIAASVEAFMGTPFADLHEITGPCTCPSSITCGATACANDAACAGGYCINGFCTDACGRCSP